MEFWVAKLLCIFTTYYVFFYIYIIYITYEFTSIQFFLIYTDPVGMSDLGQT